MSETTAWYESWFDSPYYHILYQHRDEKEAEQFLHTLLGHLNPSPDSCILDMPCGKGRHAIYLSQKGYDVYGIDLSENSISIAKKAENNHLHFDVHDMRQVYKANTFDYVFNLFTSFGYFENEADNHLVIESAKTNLKENGVFVMDFINVQRAIQNLIPEEEKVLDGIRFRIKRFVENEQFIKQISFEKNGKSYFFEEKVQALDIHYFKALFKQHNLNITAIFGDYELRPYNEQESDRLIMVAEKS